MAHNCKISRFLPALAPLTINQTAITLNLRVPFTGMMPKQLGQDPKALKQSFKTSFIRYLYAGFMISSELTSESVFDISRGRNPGPENIETGDGREAGFEECPTSKCDKREGLPDL